MPEESFLGLFATWLLVSFGAVVSPGPVSAAIVSESPRQGWRVGPLVASGHAGLELILTILIAFGLSTPLSNPQIVRILGILGGGLLLLIGGSYLYGGIRGTMQLPSGEVASTPRPASALISLGVLTTVSNPFWYAWWITVGASYLIRAQNLGLAGISLFYLGHVGADYAWDTLLSAAIGTGRRWLNSTTYRILILGTGGFMLYLGGVFIWSSL